MGCGIAHVSAVAGYKVHLYDLSAERIEAGLATINGNLARQVSSGKMTDDDRKKALSLIKGSTDINDLSDADLVIEAATEDETVKRKIYGQVCTVLKPEAVLATNTSSLSITCSMDSCVPTHSSTESAPTPPVRSLMRAPQKEKSAWVRR